MTRTPAPTRMSAGSARRYLCRQGCFVNRLENPVFLPGFMEEASLWRARRQRHAASPCRKRLFESPVKRDEPMRK